MQRFHADFERVLRSVESLQVERCDPGVRALSRSTFPVRALLRALTVARGGGHVHLGDAALAPLGWLVRSLCPEARLTLTACGLDVVYPRAWYQWLIVRSLPAFDVVHCISAATAREVSVRGAPRERIVVLPCGLWPQNLPPLRRYRGASGVELLSVGRLVHRKGFAWFLEHVFPRLREEFPEAHYTIVGRGPEEELITKIIHDHGLTSSVTLRTSASDGERDALYESADLLVVPNVEVPGDMEGFGIVCIEAAARGLPVVAARSGGLPDAVVEGVTGMLFRAGDSADAESTVRAALQSPLDPAAVAFAARRTYDWNVLRERYQHALLRPSDHRHRELGRHASPRRARPCTPVDVPGTRRARTSRGVVSPP
jgi:glycosyltransferase involved in cell wall biosynthesis